MVDFGYMIFSSPELNVQCMAIFFQTARPNSAKLYQNFKQAGGTERCSKNFELSKNMVTKDMTIFHIAI